MKIFMRFLILGLIAVSLITLLFSLFKHRKGHVTGDIAIIGGSDGPTAIIIK